MGVGFVSSWREWKDASESESSAGMLPLRWFGLGGIVVVGKLFVRSRML